MARLSLLLICVLASFSARADIIEYTENDNSAGKIALGFPVPQVLDSSVPFEGFRSYDSLMNRLLALSLQSPLLSHTVLGKSLYQSEIHGFIFGQRDTPLPVMLHIAGVHAREWAAPEAVTYIAEQLVAGTQQSGIEAYLAEHVRILLAPGMNPDAIVASQTYGHKTRVGESPNQDPDTPRDGRQRRKNLRQSDGLLESAEDSLHGVDLNRNIGRFWATSSDSSNDPQSIVYHGNGPASEPETQALQQAAHLLGTQHLRLFIDTHSFARVLFYNDTGNQRLKNLTQKLGTQMGKVASIDYTPVQEVSQRGIGANDEYFAYEFEVPSYTLEIEPGDQQAAEYGGNVVSHSGFILPEDQIARVREEMYHMARLAYYHQAGPPILQAVEIREQPSNSVVYAASWQDGAAQRERVLSVNQSLNPGSSYRLNLQFDKPMRWQDAQARILNYPGQNVALAPEIQLIGDSQSQTLSLTQNAHWSSTNYRNDSYQLDFVLARNLPATVHMAVSVTDLSGHALDTNPQTPATWQDGHWVNYEGNANDSGGTDTQSQLSLNISSEPARQGGGSGSLGFWLLCLLSFYRRKALHDC